MNYLSEAFKRLEILDEDVFNLTKDGLEDLKDFEEDSDEEEEIIDVMDPDAESEEDLEDSYIGKVILDCEVCHTDIYKDKEDITIDEETQLANVGEECPYCFSNEGFKIIGEVKPFVETTFETDDDVEVEVDGEEVEEEEEVEKNESLRRNRRLRESCSINQCQKWVDYDMKKYKKISDDTMKKIKSSGYSVVKDQYGDYEVIADRKDTSKNEACDGNRKPRKSIDEGIFGGNLPDVVMVVKHGNKDTWTPMACIKDKKNMSLMQKRKKEYLNDFNDAEVKFISGKEAKKLDKKFNTNGIDVLDESLNELFGKKEKPAAVLIVRHGKGNWDALSCVKDRKNIRMLQDHQKEYMDKFDDAEAKIVSWDDAKKINKKLTIDDLHIFDESLDRKPRKSRKIKEDFDDGEEDLEYSENDINSLAAQLADIYLDINDDVTKYSYNKVSNYLSREYPEIKDKVLEILIDQFGLPMEESLKSRKSRNMKESIEDITIDTGDQEITVSAKDKEEVESDGEMIEPVSDETKDEIEANSEETEEDVEDGSTEDVDIDEFSEEDFDGLGESYLKKVYENVDSYKTTSAKIKGNKLYLEGLIKFNSGKQKKTSFIFESKTLDKNNRAKFIGENVQISRGHKAFKLTGKLDNNKFIAESLNYNYRAKDSFGNSTRVYGTVRVK